MTGIYADEQRVARLFDGKGDLACYVCRAPVEHISDRRGDDASRVPAFPFAELPVIVVPRRLVQMLEDDRSRIIVGRFDAI